jgi:diguanylate cyclase (GGDEF)-like protein
MTGTLAVVLFLGLVGLFLAGLFLARLRLEREKRRADAAESRSRSYFSVIEILARSLSREGRDAGRDREELLEAAKREGLSEEEVLALEQRMRNASLGASQESAKTLVTDPRYLFVSFEEEIRSASRKGEPLTLLTLEAEVSPAGSVASEPAVADRILRAVAHAVRGQMRGCDTCIRYGAREFILILPGVSREAAPPLEKRLRTVLRGLSLEPRPGVILQLRPVLGSATFPQEGSSFDSLLTLADVRRSRDASPHLPGGPDERSPLSPPWQHRPISPN